MIDTNKLKALHTEEFIPHTHKKKNPIVDSMFHWGVETPPNIWTARRPTAISIEPH